MNTFYSRISEPNEPQADRSALELSENAPQKAVIGLRSIGTTLLLVKCHRSLVQFPKVSYLGFG